MNIRIDIRNFNNISIIIIIVFNYTKIQVSIKDFPTVFI